VELEHGGLVIVRQFEQLAHSATTARDRLPVAVTGRPPRSLACRSRMSVFGPRATTPPGCAAAGSRHVGGHHGSGRVQLWLLR
jgi:hypothetical protein